MSVDLSELTDNLRREVAVPGEFTIIFPNTSETDLADSLAESFWEAYLDGLLPGYTADTDGIVTPTTGTTDLGRDLQQIVVFYAGVRIVRNALRNLKTTAKYVAGSVQYETQQSALVLRELLAELKRRRDILLLRLSDIGTLNTYYVDAILAREDSINWGDTYYPSAGNAYPEVWGW